MSEFKFVTWEAHIAAKIMAEGKHSDTEFGELNEMLRVGTSSDYKQISEYYFQHAVDGSQAEQNNERWNTLKHFAKIVLEAENTNDIAKYCIFLGKAITAFEVPSSEERGEYYQLRISKFNRELPLVKENIRATNMKVMMQSLARSAWERDIKKEIRLKDMAEYVWALVLEHGDIQKLPFDRPEGLKSWLRPVAKEFGYPSAQGRPKK
jgi:hypothetical protein